MADFHDADFHELVFRRLIDFGKWSLNKSGLDSSSGAYSGLKSGGGDV